MQRIHLLWPFNDMMLQGGNDEQMHASMPPTTRPRSTGIPISLNMSQAEIIQPSL